MPMNKIHVSKKARADLTEIKRYIEVELENPTAARAVTRRITDDIHALRDHAMLGAPLHSAAAVPGNYRFLVTGNYLTFYRVSGADVYVDRILYGRRDYLAYLFGKSSPQENS